jgi:DNA polymerase III delta prime subunit
MEAAGEISPKTTDLTACLEEWRRQLLDTSKRNRLVSSKMGRGGVLVIEHPEFYALWNQLTVNSQVTEFLWPSELINGEPSDGDESDAGDGQAPIDRKVLTAVELEQIKQSPDLRDGRLLTNLTDKPLDGRLGRLSIAASTSLSEQGVNSLFLAFGFLKWFESVDSETPILSPLVLLPVTLKKHSADSTWGLAALDDDLAPNHSLAELLRSEFQLPLPQFAEDQLWESSDALKNYLGEVRRAVSEHERWEVQPIAGLGTFAFQKIAMWQDLGKNQVSITNHPLCRGLAGDSSLLTGGDISDILTADLDQIAPPEASNLILDSDSSQLAAIEIVQKGHHLILDGPPGTGKSQTISNIIAKCLAERRTVLFVSAKAEALGVVKRRLDKARLGDFCLECHSHKANKKEVVDELGRCLNRENESYPSQDHKIAELRRTRQKLNEYVRALHVKRSALDLCAYSVHGRLAKIRTSTATRTPIADVHSVDQNRLKELEAAVARFASFEEIIAAKGIHPWRRFRTELFSLTLSDDVRFHFDRLISGLNKRIEAARPLETLGFLQPAATQADLAVALEQASAALSYPNIPPKWVDAGLLQTAEKYAALNEMSNDYRVLISSVPNYRGDAPIQIDQSVVAAATTSFTTLMSWLPALPASLRQQISHLIGASARLAAMADIADKLEAAAHRLNRLLGAPDSFISSSRDSAELAASVLGCV